MKILALLFLTSTLAAQDKWNLTITNEMVFSPFSKVEASHSGFPYLMGTKLTRSVGEINLFAKYSHSISSPSFTYSVDANSFNGAQMFATRHFDMKFSTSLSSLMMGMEFHQPIPIMKNTSLLTNVGIGMGHFMVRFQDAAYNTIDNALTYSSNNVIVDTTLTLQKSYGNVLLGIDTGYLFAHTGDGGMTAEGDYDMGYGTGWQGVQKGTTLSGILDYSGFKLGFHLGATF